MGKRLFYLIIIIYYLIDIGNYDKGVDKWINFVGDNYLTYFVHSISRTKFPSGERRNPRFVIFFK
jgi:hypothetical protein